MGETEKENSMSRDKIEEMITASKLSSLLKKNDEDKAKRTILWVLAIIGTVVAVAAIAYAVYRFFSPDFLEDFEDEFDEDFEADFFDSEDEI